MTPMNHLRHSLFMIAVAIFLICNCAVRIALAQGLSRTILTLGKSEIRWSGVLILEFADKHPAYWDSDSECFVLTSDTSDTSDIDPDSAHSFVQLIIPSGAEKVANQILSTVRVQGGEFAEDDQAWTTIGNLVLRRNERKQLVPSVISIDSSKVYLFRQIFNIPMHIIANSSNTTNCDHLIFERSWPFRSSTDLTVSEGPLGILQGTGRIEFLLLGKSMKPCINMGEGAHLRLVQLKSDVELIDSDGHTTKTRSGEYRFTNQRWKAIRAK